MSISESMEHVKTRDTVEEKPDCVVCGREAVTIDRKDSAMCAKHAALFVTRDHRDSLADRPRLIR